MQKFGDLLANRLEIYYGTFAGVVNSDVNSVYIGKYIYPDCDSNCPALNSKGEACEKCFRKPSEFLTFESGYGDVYFGVYPLMSEVSNESGKPSKAILLDFRPDVIGDYWNSVFGSMDEQKINSFEVDGKLPDLECEKWVNLGSVKLESHMFIGASNAAVDGEDLIVDVPIHKGEWHAIGILKPSKWGESLVPLSVILLHTTLYKDIKNIKDEMDFNDYKAQVYSDGVEAGLNIASFRTQAMIDNANTSFNLSLYMGDMTDKKSLSWMKVKESLSWLLQAYVFGSEEANVRVTQFKGWSEELFAECLMARGQITASQDAPQLMESWQEAN